MLGGRPIALVTALGVGLLATPALADPVVIVWPGSPTVQVSQAEAALRAEGVSVVPWATAREAVAEHRVVDAAEQQARRARVEAALGEAQASFLRLEFEPMLQALDEAEADAVAVAEPGACDGLWELAFRRGLGAGARRAEGDEAASLVHYGLALALEPDRRPLGELYGPDVTAAFLDAVQVRAETMARPLALQVHPPDATVEIDCRANTESAPQLRPGLHAVVVRAPGYRPWARVAQVGDEARLEITLTPLPPELPARRLAVSTTDDAVDADSPSAYAAVMAVAKGLGADAVLVASTGEAGFRVRPWGRDGIGATVERPSLEQAAVVAVGLLEHDGRLATPAPGVLGSDENGRPRVASRKPVLRTWWFWTIVGGVALTGAAVGLGVGLSGRQTAPGRLIVVAR